MLIVTPKYVVPVRGIELCMYTTPGKGWRYMNFEKKHVPVFGKEKYATQKIKKQAWFCSTSKVCNWGRGYAILKMKGCDSKTFGMPF